MYLPTPACRRGRLSPTINDMSVATPEAAAKPDSPPETTEHRNLYILLLLCGFILRFGFVLWHTAEPDSLRSGGSSPRFSSVSIPEKPASRDNGANYALTFFPPRT